MDPENLEELMQMNNARGYALIRLYMKYNCNFIQMTYPEWNRGNILHGLVHLGKHVTPSTLQEWMKTITYARLLGCAIHPNEYGQTPLEYLMTLYRVVPHNIHYKELERRLYSEISVNDIICL